MSIGGAIIHRVLIVEDDPDEREFLKGFLTRKRYDVDVARDGGQAHSAFTMHQPDFVILDLILARESGFEVCERMKQINQNIPILILTAIDMDDARDLAFRVGADGYMTKPFDPEELVTRMTEIGDQVWRKSHGLESSRVSDDRVKFHCPECGKRMKVKAVHRGRTLNCPQCGQPVVVPRHD